MGLARAAHLSLANPARSSNDNADDLRATNPVPAAPVPTSQGVLPEATTAQSGVTRIALAGVIEGGLIASLLQMWTESASTGTLQVSTDDMDGAIVLEHGHITSAHMGCLLGRAASFGILSLEDGLFRYVRREPRTEPTHDDRAAARANIRELLLSWTRITIESTGRPRHTPSAPPLIPADVDALDRLSWPVDEKP